MRRRTRTAFTPAKVGLSREHARHRNLPWYRAPEPCHRGHAPIRRTLDGKCRECVNEASRASYDRVRQRAGLEPKDRTESAGEQARRAARLEAARLEKLRQRVGRMVEVLVRDAAALVPSSVPRDFDLHPIVDHVVASVEPRRRAGKTTDAVVLAVPVELGGMVEVRNVFPATRDGARRHRRLVTPLVAATLGDAPVVATDMLLRESFEELREAMGGRLAGLLRIAATNAALARERGQEPPKLRIPPREQEQPAEGQEEAQAGRPEGTEGKADGAAA